MGNPLPQPDAEIARFVRVTQAEDGMLDIFIADNYREDFKVQYFVSRVQKSLSGARTRWASLSLDEIANVALFLSSDAPAHSVNQQRVLAISERPLRYRRLTCTIVGRDGGGFCYIEARGHGELQCLDCIDKDEGMALAATIYSVDM